MNRIAIIPARGGSKRIPLKNIKPFAGIPMISHPISKIQDSKLFGRIVVTSDSTEILNLANTLGAETLVRPAHLADDMTPTIPVVRHALQELMTQDSSIVPQTQVFCFYPTNPFLRMSDVGKGIRLIEDELNLDFVAPIVKYSYPIQRALLIRDGKTEFRESHNVRTRSQDLEETFHDAGQWYGAKANVWLDERSELLQNTIGLEIPPWRSYDIDTIEDWKMAEIYFSAFTDFESRDEL